MKEPVFVAFSTQKGGAGKTTMTVLMASYLYYVKGYKVLAVDCDFPQYSIKDMRDRDIEVMKFNPVFKKAYFEQAKRLGTDPYPILTARPEDAMIKVREVINSGHEYDIVFFDLPGTINNSGVVKTVACMDYIFCPVAADKLILESSLAFALKVHNEIITTGKSSIRQFQMLWNLVDARERTELYDLYERVFEEYGLATMKTRIPDTKRYRREGSKEINRPVFRSTMLPPDKTLLKGSRVEELAAEILSIIGLTKQ